MTKFKVGDVVIVKETMSSDRPDECAFGFVKGMDSYRGKIVKIIEAEEYDARGTTGKYRIDVDHERYAWCDKCFELVIETPENDEITNLEDLL